MKVLLLLFLGLPVFSTAQGNPPDTYFSGDTLYTRSGYKIILGEKLTIGAGSMQNGDFRYIRVSSYSVFRRSSNKEARDQENAFSPHFKGLQFKVIRIDRRGNKKQTYDYFPIISGGIVRYEIDIDNAISSGEIVVPEEYKLKTPPSTIQAARN